ncbi:methyl-accepting chemotaxis protein [Herbaspirillum sp. RTI4]|uniref:methyl-accepting chemotaxis protein n=1 Tax=Herbaspirillum sp. RTI4 TaxID=3048640 RepID=UPI002AB53962|nr:methyl-accepting chemotaxis protein [Herbaspirillum sp. RTI4]MDY7578995.1 methyl-accepting chemotaxis protein [Herbaspirillum sp. RTI4]MEA9980926.1 methyl-accepting chemotaxis protein [Herbaspirillum sp. RTI4]
MLFSTLRTRLIAICTSIVVLAMLAVVGTNFITTKSHVMESLDNQTKELSHNHAAMIAEWVKANKAVVSSIRLAVDSPEPLAAVKQAEQAGRFDLTYIGYADKHTVFSQERTRAANYDPTARPWYIKAAQTNGPIVTAPYTSASTGKLLVTFAEAIGAPGSVTAVVGADVLLDTVVKNVVAIKPTPNSFSFLVDNTGKIIAHPDEKLRMKPLTDLDPALSGAKLTDIENTGNDEPIRLNGRDTFLNVTKVEGTDWLLVIALDKNDATIPLTALLKSSAVTAFLVMCLATIALGLLISTALKRLQLVRDALAEIATGDGDLTRRLDAEGTDELAQIAVAFNRFVDKIATVLREIRSASESVKGATGEIADGNADLSARTEAQAGSLEETASAMEELTEHVKKNADNARLAHQLSGSTSEVATKGGVMVTQVIETMSSINEASKKIVDIIGVIDGIAFQTNILALNAAVEAARAGEQGRGFAVVASEVRSLAQRSATAAKEIKILIDTSVSRVDEGGTLVQQAGETMTQVVESVKRVNHVVSEITTASAEQSQSIEQINQAIGQMDDVTQQNSALVEQAAAAAESLQEQATMLAHAVSTFRLDAAAPHGGSARLVESGH